MLDQSDKKSSKLAQAALLPLLVRFARMIVPNACNLAVFIRAADLGWLTVEDAINKEAMNAEVILRLTTSSKPPYQTHLSILKPVKVGPIKFADAAE